MRERTSSVAAAALALLSACANVDPRPDHAEARSLIEASTGQEQVFDAEAPPLTKEEIAGITSDGLGFDEALRLALLNNRRLQAGFFALGVARAEFVQAGLLKNPSLSVAFLLPSGGGQPKIAFDVFESVVDLWEIPTRKEIARAELSRQVLELSRFAGGLVADTKDAYYRSVAARDAGATAREGLALARQSLDAVHQRVEGGIATSAEESLARGVVLGAELDLRRAEREDLVAKRNLAKLLSLEEDLIAVELVDPIPAPTLLELDREALVANGRSSRLDVRAAASAVEAAEARVPLEQRRVFSAVELGVSAERPERDASVGFMAGPAARVELPVFDQNQARISGAAYRAEALRRELAALVIEVGQEIRSAVDRAASAARTAAFVADELLPQAEVGATLARNAYDLGDTTLLPLLESQRAVLIARRNRSEALLEAALSRVDLERVAGAPVEGLITGPAR